MYRNEEDMKRSFNALCSALHKTGSRCLAENLYATPLAFNYLVTRKSGEDWYKEQEVDGNGLPLITLEGIES